MNVPLIDMCFCGVLLVLAGCALRVRDLFAGVVLFVTFGLLVALAWARLNATDLALAEAALGAGLVGALFLASLHRVAAASGGPPTNPPPVRRRHLLLLAPPLAVIVSSIFFGWMPAARDGQSGGLTRAAYAAASDSGVENVVTATLLNYRSYDTLLELGVIFLVTLAVLNLQPGRIGTSVRTFVDPVLADYTRVMAPGVLLVAGYLLWAGASRAGGAFQAGSILAGAGVLLLLTYGSGRLNKPGAAWRLTAAAGFGVFAVFGLVLPQPGSPPLTWPPGWAKPAILIIETVATVSIAASLILLFAACANPHSKGPVPSTCESPKANP